MTGHTRGAKARIVLACPPRHRPLGQPDHGFERHEYTRSRALPVNTVGPPMSAVHPIRVAEEEPDFSAEGAIERELALISAWLAAHSPEECAGDTEGVAECYQWRSGYFAGLERALAMLSSRGATLH